MSARAWAPWAAATATAVLTVAVGISINQVHPTDFDRTGLAWLIAALLCAGAAGALTHWAAPALPTAPVPRLWPSVTTREGRPRLLGELSARDLGTHPCRFAADAQNPYLERDADPDLARALADADQRLVIVSGPRLAGATRTLAHAAQRLLADHTVAAFLEDPAISLQAMVETAGTHTRDDRGAVLWLDALTADRYTELARLDPATLPEGLRILATLDTAVMAGHRIPATLRDHVQAHAAVIDLPTLTGTERDRIRAEDAYADLHPVLDEGGDLLLGRLLVSWNQVRTALTRGTGEEATDRIALLRAVTDWARLDPPRRLNRAILPHLYRAYRNALTGRPPGADFSQYRYKQALAWATTPTRDRPLLVDERTDGSGTYYTPHPLLSALADQEGESVAWPVADQMWTYADTFFDGHQRRDLGYTALRLGAHTTADRLLGHGDADIDPYAMNGLATWFKNNDHPATARKWYTRAVDTGHPEAAPKAMNHLGNLESGQGRIAQARAWYTRAADTHHPDVVPKAMNHLGNLESGQGRVEAARTWYMRAIDTGHPDVAPQTMRNLGILESGQGRVGEARAWYMRAIDTGHSDAAPNAMNNLGLMERKLDRVGEARAWYMRAIDTGHSDAAPNAMNNLGFLEERLGCVGEARAWYTRAIDTGHSDTAPNAMCNLGALEAGQGRVEEARAWYMHAIDTNHPDYTPSSMYNLGNLERERGRVEAARTWYTRVIDTNHPKVAPQTMCNLGILEAGQGRVGEARAWYTRAIDTDHSDAAPNAMNNLGALEAGQGRVEEARTWYMRAIDTNHPDAAPKASQTLRRLGEQEQERQQADHYSKHGWMAHADLELIRRANERPHGEPDGGANDRADTEELADDAASSGEGTETSL